MSSSYSSRMREDSQMTGAKVAKLLQFESSMSRLSRDVEKLMAVSAQHGMKIKELIVSAANSVSQVEFMAAITTTRFQNLNVVNTMKSASEKPDIETAKPSVPVSAGNREEVDQLKAQVIQLENEIFNQNFKNGMEVKRLENEVKARQKEIYDVKNTIRQLEDKLEKFADAVEAGGISTNVRFAHAPTEPSTPMAGSIHTTPGGRKQSLFVFSDEMAESPLLGDNDRRFALTPGGTELGDIPEGMSTEQGGDIATLAFPELVEQAEGGAHPALPTQPESAQVTSESASSSAASLPMLTPPTSGQRRRSTLRAQRMSMHPALLSIASTHAGNSPTTQGSPASANAPAASLPASVPQLPPVVSILEQQITEEDVEEWSQYIFDQFNNIMFVQKTAELVAENGIAAALRHFEDSEERLLREKIQLERMARSVDSVTQTDELSSRARRATMRNDVRKASLLSTPRDAPHPDPSIARGDQQHDVMTALMDFQQRNNILPAEELPDYVYHSGRKKKHSMRRSIHKEQYKERAASLLVRVNGRQSAEEMMGYGPGPGEQTSDILDLHSGDVSLILPPQAIPPSSAGIDTSPPPVDTRVFPSTPGSTRTPRSARMPSGFLPPPGSSFSQAQDTAMGGLAASSDSRPRLRGSVDFTLTGSRKSIHAPGTPLHSSISRPPTSKSRANSLAKPTAGIAGSTYPSEATLGHAERPKSHESGGEINADEEQNEDLGEEREEEDIEDEEEEEEAEAEAERQGQFGLRGGFLPSQLHLSHTPLPAQNYEATPALPELHIEPLFLDDLSDASSSVFSAPPPAQTFLKPSLGVQNIVEEAKDDIMDMIDRKFIKLCDHLNVRFQFVENQYQRNNAYLFSMHNRMAAIHEYIVQYSSPVIQQLIELFNAVADRVGELEAVDKNLLAPMQEAMEKYHDDLREFRDNVDDLMQFKVREAVLQVYASEQSMQRSGQEPSVTAKKEKSPIALEGQEAEERATKYAQTIFYADPSEQEVSLYDAERMQRQLRYYANLFEDLYGQHGSLLQRIQKLEEGPAYLSQTTRRRVGQLSQTSPRPDPGESSTAHRPSSRLEASGKVAFSDDLPPTPFTIDPSRSPARRSPFGHTGTNSRSHTEAESDMKQLREEVDFLKALLQVRLDPGFLAGQADDQATTTRRVKSIPSSSATTSTSSAKPAGGVVKQVASKAAIAHSSSVLTIPSVPAAAAPSSQEEEVGGTLGSAIEQVLPHLRPTTPSDQRAGRAVSSPSTRLAVHPNASKAALGAYHHGGATHPARPNIPKPNPLLMASPRKVVLSLDGADSHAEGDAGHKKAPLSHPTAGSTASQPAESFTAYMEARKLHMQFVPMATARDPPAAMNNDAERRKVWYHASSLSTPQPQLDSRPESPTSDILKQ